MRAMKTAAVLTALALAVPVAAAHDTWFEPLQGGGLALGTGNRFPVMDLAVDDKFFARRGCVAAGGRPRALEKLRFTDNTTLLRPTTDAATCFVQLVAFEVELPQDKIDLYFKEIRPSDAAVAAWEQLRARGLPFKERYVKSARVDLAGAAGAAGVANPVGMTMDALRLAPEGALTVGAEAVFEVLRDGQPLAGFNVELVNERSPIGLWHRTDAQGRIRARLPLAGRWLLRGTDLRIAGSGATRFESWFITYAFEVGP